MQDAAVHLGMQRLDAAIEHFGEAGEFGDVFDRDAGVAQQLGGASGGDELDAEGGELAGEIYQSGFVGDAENGALDPRFGDMGFLSEDLGMKEKTSLPAIAVTGSVPSFVSATRLESQMQFCEGLYDAIDFGLSDPGGFIVSSLQELNFHSARHRSRAEVRACLAGFEGRRTENRCNPGSGD